MTQTRREYLKIKKATVIIQQKWKATLQSRHERTQFSALKDSVVKIQSLFRMRSAVKKYTSIKSSVLTIHSRFRGIRIRLDVITKLEAIYVIQYGWRAVLLARQVKSEYTATRKNIIKVQSYVRMALQRQK